MCKGVSASCSSNKCIITMRWFPSLVIWTAAASSPLATAVEVVREQAWNITTDPQGSVRLNGLAFQQNALTTFKHHQYVAFYTTANETYGEHYVGLGRRRVWPCEEEWEYLTLTDYLQTTLDEHNTISLGISGDGKIHLSFDHHVSLARRLWILNFIDLAGCAIELSCLSRGHCQPRTPSLGRVALWSSPAFPARLRGPLGSAHLPSL